MRLATFVASSLALGAFFGTAAALCAQPAGGPEATAHLAGTVVDARRRPVGEADVRATGSGASAATRTTSAGTFAFDLKPGVYTIAVRKAGYQNVEATDVALVAGTATKLELPVVEATTANLRVIGAVSARGNAPSSSITAVSSLPLTTLPERQSISLQDVLPEVAGVTFSRGTSADPYEFFAVRGALIETRVQLDGHPIVLGTSGKFNLDQVNPQVFGAIDVFKGTGVNVVDAGESAFGTVDLRTRDFTSTNRYQAQLGIDNYGAQSSVFAASGNLLPRDKLSYVFDFNVAGILGPENGIVANQVFVDPADATKAIVAFQQPLDDRVRESSELAKLRYRFSDETSLSLAYVGFQGYQSPQGIAYGTSVGNVLLEPSIGSPNDPSSVFTAPYAQNLTGTVVRGYQWFPGTVTFQNEPFFEGELRTTLRDDTLLLRPYTGVVTRVVDGSGEAFLPNGIFGEAWSLVTDPASCTATLPCYPSGARAGFTTGVNPCATERCFQPQNDFPYHEIEVNRLHGTTFTYLHPYGPNGTLDFTYDYHSNFAYDYYGNPDPAVNDGTLAGSSYVISTAPTTARNNDFGLSTTYRITPQLTVAGGEYLTNWNLEYQIEDPAVVAAAPPGTNILDLPVKLVQRSRATWHSDPRIGFNYRPNAAFALRASAGTALSVPYASQVSGVPSITNPSGTSNGLAVLQNVNPNLNPEVTVAYGLGADFSLPNRSLLSLDLFHDTIHNAFIQSTFPVANPPAPVGGQRPYGLEAQWFNGPIERNYGIELTLASAPRAHLGYYASATFQRAYYDQLPASFYASGPSSAINGVQVDGASQIPYVQAHGELRYALAPDVRLSFGADYTGANNWTYGPAFTTCFATLAGRLGGLGTFRLAIDNVFNHTNGDPYGIAIQNGGYSTIQLGPSGSGNGLAYSSLAQPLQSIAPRTLRFALERRFGS